MKLHELAHELRDLEAMIEEGGEDIDNDSFSAALDGLNIELESKVSNLGLWIKSLQAEAEMIKAEEARLAKRRKGKEGRIAGIRQYLAVNMASNVKTPLVTVSRRSGSDSVQIDDASKIPSDYFIPQEPKLDKALVKKALKDGFEVPGAQLVTGQPTVTIR